MPSVSFASRKVLTINLGAQAVARSMTGSAVPNAVCEIGAAIPFSIVAGILLVRTLVEEKQLPAGDEEPDIQREGQVIVMRPCLYRLSAHHVGVQRSTIFIVDEGVVVVRESRI